MVVAVHLSEAAQISQDRIFSDGSVSTNEHHLYAISAVLTVPPPIPEPSTLILFLAGILGVSGLGYVRKKRQSAEL